jgi:hypothetical protein
MRIRHGLGTCFEQGNGFSVFERWEPVGDIYSSSSDFERAALRQTHGLRNEELGLYY